MSDTQRLARAHGIPEHEVKRLVAATSATADVSFGRLKRRPYTPTPPAKADKKQED